MKTTVDIPDDLANEVHRRAAADGRELGEAVVDLLRKGLSLPATGSAEIATDETTGLPVIQSPPDAPIWRMSAAHLDALIEREQLEEDLERAGLPIRR